MKFTIQIYQDQGITNLQYSRIKINTQCDQRLHKKVNTIDNKFLVFKIDKNPGPGSYNNYETFKDEQNNCISQYTRTGVPKIKLRYKGGPSKHDRVPYNPSNPSPA